MWPPPDLRDGWTGEICGTCLRMIVWCDAFTFRVDLRNEAEMGSVGGTYLVGHRCTDHAPVDATSMLDSASTMT